MNTCSTSLSRRREVDALLTRGLAAAEHTALRDHLRGCMACRGYYNEARRLEEELSGAPGLSMAAVERLGELVIAPAPARERQRAWPIAWAFALTAAVAVVVLAPGRDDELTPRGAESSAAPATLSIFVIEERGGEPAVRRLERVATGAPLSRGATVQLAYRNEAFERAIVLGLDESFTVHWYHLEDGERGVRLLARVHDEPFGQAWSIEADPGAVRLFAVFGGAALSRAEVERAVARAKESGAGLRAIERLPGLAAHQDSVLLEVR